MALDTHYQVMYADVIRELAGFLYQPRLPKFVDHDAKQGEAVFFDTIAPLDNANLDLMTAGAKYRKDYEATSKTIADLDAILTPHMEVDRTRTISVPYQNEVGHVFRKTDKIGEGADPKNRTLKQLLSRINRNRDLKILSALNAFTVNRGKTQGTLSAISLPSSQYFNVSDGQFDKEILNEVRTQFETNFAEDEQICIIISPVMKKELIDNSGDKIHSSDFVMAMNNNFEKGQLPEVYGVVCIVHPFATSYTTSNSLTWTKGVAHAFTKSALVYNQFEGLETYIGQSASQRGSVHLYIDEFIDCVRIDDKKVMHVQLGTGS